MKSFIITLLIYYCFCGELTHLKKYNYFSFSSEGISGITSLKIEDVDLNDDIHILFIVREGTMNKEIYYGFSNEDSKNASSISLPYYKEPTYNEYFCADDHYCGHKYYYDIEKTENAKYIIMKYNGYNGEYLDVDRMSLSANHYFIIYIVIIMICIAGCFIYYYYYRKKKLMINMNKNIASNQTQTPLNVPDNQPNITNNNPSNNTPNPYYETPQPVANNY